MSDNESNSGWISIYRKIRNHWIWQDPVKLKWWIDILLAVNHEDKKVNIGVKLIECKRGQCIMSLQNWAKRWNVSKGAARNFLELLKKDGMIHTENISISTRITVCNYDIYQGSAHASKMHEKRVENGWKTDEDPNNNDDNYNKRVDHLNSEDNLKKKESELKESIEPFIPIYGKDICNNFYLYWSEPNKSKTKLRYEMEKTWDVERRLANWVNRDNTFNNRNNTTNESPHYEKL